MMQPRFSATIKVAAFTWGVFSQSFSIVGMIFWTLDFRAIHFRTRFRVALKIFAVEAFRQNAKGLIRDSLINLRWHLSCFLTLVK
jgi:hypothetical protein